MFFKSINEINELINKGISNIYLNSSYWEKLTFSKLKGCATTFLLFFFFKCYDVIKYLSMKHEHILLNNFRSKHSLVMKLNLANLCNITKRKKRNYQKTIWKLRALFNFSKNPLWKGIWGGLCANLDKFL